MISPVSPLALLAGESPDTTGRCPMRSQSDQRSKKASRFLLPGLESPFWKWIFPKYRLRTVWAVELAGLVLIIPGGRYDLTFVVVEVQIDAAFKVRHPGFAGDLLRG